MVMVGSKGEELRTNLPSVSSTTELAYEEEEIRLILGHPFPPKAIK